MFLPHFLLLFLICTCSLSHIISLSLSLSLSLSHTHSPTLFHTYTQRPVYTSCNAIHDVFSFNSLIMVCMVFLGFYICILMLLSIYTYLSIWLFINLYISIYLYIYLSVVNHRAITRICIFHAKTHSLIKHALFNTHTHINTNSHTNTLKTTKYEYH